MTQKLTEALVVDLHTVQALDNTNVDGQPFLASRGRNHIAIMTVLGMAATKTATVKWRQATSAAKAGAKDVTGSSKVLTANVLVKAGTIALASAGAADVVEVTLTDREGNAVSSGALVQGTAWTTAATLDAALDASPIGDMAVITNASTNVTVEAKEGYSLTLEASNVGGTVTLATTKAQVMAEIPAKAVDDGFTYIYPNFATTADATAVSGVVISGDGYRAPMGQVTPFVAL